MNFAVLDRSWKLCVLKSCFFVTILIAFVAFLLVCVSLSPVAAQISAPNLLDSQFAGRADSSPAMHLTLLRSFRAEDDAPGITWEGRDELTVHVNKGREGLLEDLHTNGSVLTLRALMGRSQNTPRLTLRWEHLSGGGVDNESGDALHFWSRSDQPEGQISWPIFSGARIYLGARATTYDTNGTTQLYANLFTIFPQTPPFRYQGREHLTLAGFTLPISRLWSIEAVAGYKDEPNRLELFQSGSPTQVVFPLRDAGVTSLIAARRRLTGSTALFVVLGGERLSGTASVEREGGRQIGQAVTLHQEANWGAGWQKIFGERRTVGIFLENAQERWQTQGTVPNPADLQTHYVFTSDLHYGARYSLVRNTLGINWNQWDRRQRELQGSVQLLALRVKADADYDVWFYGLARSGRTAYNQSSLRAAGLRVGYTFPFHAVRVGLEASQLIPLGSEKSSAAGAPSGPADPNRRATSGGWTLNLRIERPL